MENSRTKTDYTNNAKPSVKPIIPIEDYFEYSIIRKNEVGTEKLSLDIRIQKEYRKYELEKFAYYIKNDYSKKSYKRIFLSFYLPDMKVGHGAWATSHFDPNLRVSVTSPYYEDTKKNTNSKPSKTQSAITDYLKKTNGKVVVGFWRQNVDVITTIFEKNRKYYLNEININTKSKGSDYELIAGTKNGKQTFVIEEFLNPNNDIGTKYIGEYTDYYLIDSNSDLILYDQLGIIEQYPRITQVIAKN